MLNLLWRKIYIVSRIIFLEFKRPEDWKRCQIRKILRYSQFEGTVTNVSLFEDRWQWYSTCWLVLLVQKDIRYNPRLCLNLVIFFILCLTFMVGKIMLFWKIQMKEKWEEYIHNQKHIGLLGVKFNNSKDL